MSTEPFTYDGPCPAGHEAKWHAVPNQPEATLTCPDCDADVPPQPVIVPPSAWGWLRQVDRRRARGVA